MNWSLWVKGLASAIIGSAANAVTVMIIDPQTFNLFDGGAKELGALMVVSAIVAGAAYLKTHPLPEPKINE